MDLDDCTQGQRKAVTTLDAPLMVAAGAGSGKTYTITQRIVRALLPDENDECYLSTVEEVCAITFTNRAAAELRSRVKSQLISEGLLDQALGVDDAWISTIHAMTGRILREQAVELGIDPSFEMLSNFQVEELRREAAELVISEVQENKDSLVAQVLAEQTKSLFDRDGMADMALRLIEKAQALPEGFDAIELAQPPDTPHELLRQLYDLGHDFLATTQTWVKPTNTEEGMIADLQTALEDARAYLDRDGADSVGFEDTEFDPDELRGIFYAFPPTSDKFHAKKDDADFFVNYRGEYARLADEVEAGTAWRKTRALVDFARQIYRRFCEIKGASRLDHSDVLTMCYDALCEFPQMAQYYRDRFRLIMIDEFQDTDMLQVALVSKLSQPCLDNVCTVGDAQQSIYRFRGADLQVFFDYRQDLFAQNDNARMVSLPDNFRSHADVLAWVDAIFSQPQVFGDEFLHLEPCAALNDEFDPTFDGDTAKDPRLVFDIIHYPRSVKGIGGLSGRAREEAAKHIAERFVGLVDAGQRAGDMVILLGKMTHARVYADALRDAGLESIIVGGSVFSDTDEAQLVANLLNYAVNTNDEPALFSILTSQLFALPDDVLLALASRRDDDGTVRQRPLSQGFSDTSGGDDLGLSARLEEALTLARKALQRFVRQARIGRVSNALRELFVETGMLDRDEVMGADGLARAGNIAKALTLVEALERENAGISSLAVAYCGHLNFEKEPPGALSTVDSDFVRIMTVHASKGLEFDHVAIAELGNGTTRRESFYAENFGKNTVVAMSTPATGDFGNIISKLRGFSRVEDAPSIDEAETPGELYRAIAAYANDQSLAEARRLLYVAMTRARRSLMISTYTSSKPNDAYANDGIYRDVYTALNWDTTADKLRETIDLEPGATVEVAFENLKVTPNDDDVEDNAQLGEPNASSGETPDEVPPQNQSESADDFIIPKRAERPEIILIPCESPRKNVCSYSSLSNDVDEDDVHLHSTFDEDDELDRTEDETATDLGTAFHLLSQRSILRRNADVAGRRELPMPKVDEICALAHAQELSDTQTQRLIEACERWFSCDLIARIADFDSVLSEVPFMVALDAAQVVDTAQECPERFYLEGAIDILATDGDGTAEVVDFKTGGFDAETPEELYDKHLFQAQCYAYELLCEGFTGVHAHFVRVEHLSTIKSVDSTCTPQPQIIDYAFTADDKSALHDKICAAWLSADSA